MLLVFIICSIVALSVANPLHKYPYVFLLDVGNEELEKTNSEQLRVSIPGGSLAVKYPAMGEGDPITHVRVSGIDFGTDLKVNIVEGGPGYKYVVLMFMGNPGVTYDAVITLQTVQPLPKEMKFNLKNINKNTSSKNSITKPYEVSEVDSDDRNQNSINDSKNIEQYSKKNNEIMQSTSTFYNYAKNEMNNDDEDEESQNVSAEEHNDNDDDSSDEDEEDEKDFSNKKKERISNEGEPKLSYQGESENSDGIEDEDEEDEHFKTKLYRGQYYNQVSSIPRAEQYRYNADPNNAGNDKPVDIVDDRLYNKYQDLKPHFGLGYRVYPQSFIYNTNKQYQVNSAFNNEDPVELEQMFNDEEVHNDATSRFKDGSNNIDSDYLIAEY